jgi:hypothetical protein
MRNLFGCGLKCELCYCMYIYIYMCVCVCVYVPVQGGPHGCETSRFPHFSRNQLTDGSEVVILTSRPCFTPTKIPGTHFCWRLSQSLGYSAVGRIISPERSNVLLGNRTRDLPACSIVPQPTTPLSATIIAHVFAILCLNCVLYERFLCAGGNKYN